MNPHIQLFLAILGLSAVFTYVWWMKFRVWRFREDLFLIRDTIWDRAREANELHLEAYREFREGINAVIRLAPMLSIFTLLHLIFALEPRMKPILATDLPPYLAEA